VNIPFRKIQLISLLITLIFAGCEDDSPGVISGDEPDTSVIRFRDGISPYPAYYGSRDAVIKNAPLESLRNLNWGAMEADTAGSTMINSGRYQKRLLIRMDITGISGCEEVLEAELTLRVYPSPPDSVLFRMYRITPDDIPDYWAEGEGKGDYNMGVSWDYATEAIPWDEPGGDYILPALDSVHIGADSTATFNLPPSLVEEWISNPLDNDGVIIKPDYFSDGYKIFYSRDHSRPELRPELMIKYLGYG